MPDARTIATYLLSATATLGPLAYILFAFYEMGRLNFFGAPVEFLQMSSFGIIPVVTTVYPAIVLTFVMISIVSGVHFATPRGKIILVAAAFTYAALIFFNLSMTPTWRWVFGIAAAVGGLAALGVKKFEVVVSDDFDKSAQHLYQTSRYTYCLCGFIVFAMCFSAAGNKNAASDEYYWVTGDNVVLGFYGDQVLIGERRGSEVGPKFRVAELKSLEGSLTQLRVGPLRAASMWKSTSPADRPRE
ncbi:hypothetical protein [Pseudomonas sp. P7548]|uniref:hypothetical protein n=1 Tax=Pseudomonas sp. P7548 TaxID=2726981 RepID=UPI0015C11B38|nr:hypothetical protein [Pseudomonas sp. P7548]NWE18048.1 hypothetical protein [Pseudomonas sp. P7548]